MKPNVEQQKAISHIDGPMLILAGAGSGKTTVLMNRVVHLLKHGVPPYRILAVTFTNKAAEEMRERMTNYVKPSLASTLKMCTFHSLCTSILRAEKKEPFDIVLPHNASSDLKQILRGRTLIKSRTILGYISLLKNEMVDAKAYETKSSSNPYIDWKKVNRIIASIDPKHKEVLNWAYRAYEELLNKKNLMDFDDLILQTIQLFRRHPTILQKYQSRYQYIMVDEYQDTNRAQYIVMKLLAARHQNLVVVGDDAQSIYAFRGSDIRNILNFDKDYPRAKIVKLEENYRSTKTILAASNAVLTHNQSQKNKTLYTSNPKGELLHTYKGDDAYNEALYTAQTIKDLVNNNVYTHKDIAVLFRTNAQSASLEQAFRDEGVPYVLLSGAGFYEREEIKDIIEYLMFVHNSTYTASFERIIRKPKRRIAEKTLKRLVEETYDKDLLSVLENTSSIVRMQKKAKEESLTFAKLIRKLQKLAQTVSVATLIETLLTEIQYEEKVLSLHNQQIKEEKKLNIARLLDAIYTKEKRENRTILLHEYIEEVSLFNSGGELEGNDAVQLMTIHGSKGLEFPVVFVNGLNEDTFPAYFAIIEKDNHPFSPKRENKLSVEEERRMCYVAFTRAKEKLYLTYSSKRLKKNGEYQPLFPSRFLNEFPSSLCRHME